MNGTRENNKYLAVNLMRTEEGVSWKKRKKIMKIHRLMLMAFVGLPQKGQVACHKDDVKTNNFLDNLYWGTASTNAKDAIKNGKFYQHRPSFGENHHLCKYTDELISKLRSEYTGEYGEQARLARKYGISPQTISPLLRNKIRKGVR